MASGGAGFAMDNPVVRAEIEFVAADRDIELAGFGRAGTVTVATGQQMTLPTRRRPQPRVLPRPARPRPRTRPRPIRQPEPGPTPNPDIRPRIAQPPPLKRKIIKGERLAPIPRDRLAHLGRGEPIVLSVYSPGGGPVHIDARQIRPVMAQAARLGRRLVIGTYGEQDG